MKNCILFIIFISIFLPVKAQIYIDYNDIAKKGENFIYAIKKFRQGEKNIDDLGTSTWDIRGLKPDTYDTIRFLSPKNTRYGYLYTDANLAVYTKKTKVDYWHVTKEYVQKVGLIDDYLNVQAAVLLFLPEFITVYEFPFTLGKQYSDTTTKNFLTRYHIKPGVDSIRADMTIIESSEFDATGKLITPVGAYQTIREKRIIKKDIRGYKFTMFGWTPAPEYTRNTEQYFYRWYSENCGIPIAEAATTRLGKIKWIKYQFKEPMRLIFNAKNVNCKGGTNGALNLDVKGGIPGYTFKWSNNWKRKDLYDIPAGTYSVEVTDNKGNKKTGSYSVTEPQNKLRMDIDTFDIRCFGESNGALSVKAKGGVPPYFIVWSNDSVGNSIDNLAEGIYGVIIKDANRCFIWDSVELKAPEAPLNFTYETIPVSCKGGSDGGAKIFVTGGTPPYRFSWSNGDLTQTLNNVEAGLYTLIVKDKHNCTKTKDIRIKEPTDKLEVSLVESHVKCWNQKNGSIDLLVRGGKPPYEYVWSNENETKNVKGLAAGKYIVSVKDNYNCIVKDSVIINQPDTSLHLVYNKKDISCFAGNDGEINLTIKGGTPNYEIAWSNGSRKSNITNCRAGIYTIRVSDRNNCLLTETIELLQPESAIYISGETNHVSCKDGNNGAIMLEVGGGTKPYSYFWSNDKTTQNLNFLKKGKYKVTIKDSLACEAEKEFIINEPSEHLVIDLKTKDVSCFGFKDGSAIAKISGGVPPYTLNWSNKQEGYAIAGLDTGKYLLIVKDNRNCEQNKVFKITQPNALSLNADIRNPEQNKTNGKIVLNIKGGTKPYNIKWFDGDYDHTKKNMGKGEYTVIIIDKNSCVLEETIKLEAKSEN